MTIGLVLVISVVVGGVTIAVVASYRAAANKSGKRTADPQALAPAAPSALSNPAPLAAQAPRTNSNLQSLADTLAPHAPSNSQPLATPAPNATSSPQSPTSLALSANPSPQPLATPVPSATSAAHPPTMPRNADNLDLEFTIDTLAKAQSKAPTKTLAPSEVLAKLFELALGRARPPLSVTAGHDDIAAAVATTLTDIASQERYAPRRPDMLPKILSASNDDRFSGRELAALLARDPALVGNLLKIANSSYYRVTPEPVESVERAVVLLGTEGIRSLVTTSLMQPIFRIGGADFPLFPEIAWEHTFRSASATVPYNFLMEKSDPFAAELLSLVMGLAEVVIFRVTMDQYAKYPRLRPDAGVVSSLLDKHSAAVARSIGASWELSEPTLLGLDGQTTTTTSYPTALGRSLYFGRVVGALAVLRIKHVVDDETGKASIPGTSIPEAQLERMWTRLTTS